MQVRNLRQIYRLVPVAALIVGSAAFAQSPRSNSTQPRMPGPTGTAGPNILRTPPLDPMAEPDNPSILLRRENARKLERKKRMVDAANRLLALTEQFQKDLHGREMTPEDEKRLDEIAKLARSVKDQMRD